MGLSTSAARSLDEEDVVQYIATLTGDNKRTRLVILKGLLESIAPASLRQTTTDGKGSTKDGHSNMRRFDDIEALITVYVTRYGLLAVLNFLLKASIESQTNAGSSSASSAFALFFPAEHDPLSLAATDSFLTILEIARSVSRVRSLGRFMSSPETGFVASLIAVLKRCLEAKQAGTSGLIPKYSSYKGSSSSSGKTSPKRSGKARLVYAADEACACIVFIIQSLGAQINLAEHAASTDLVECLLQASREDSSDVYASAFGALLNLSESKTNRSFLLSLVYPTNLLESLAVHLPPLGFVYPSHEPPVAASSSALASAESNTLQLQTQDDYRDDEFEAEEEGKDNADGAVDIAVDDYSLDSDFDAPEDGATLARRKGSSRPLRKDQERMSRGNQEIEGARRPSLQIDTSYSTPRLDSAGGVNMTKVSLALDIFKRLSKSHHGYLIAECGSSDGPGLLSLLMDLLRGPSEKATAALTVLENLCAFRSCRVAFLSPMRRGVEGGDETQGGRADSALIVTAVPLLAQILLKEGAGCLYVLELLQSLTACEAGQPKKNPNLNDAAPGHEVDGVQAERRGNVGLESLYVPVFKFSEATQGEESVLTTDTRGMANYESTEEENGDCGRALGVSSHDYDCLVWRFVRVLSLATPHIPATQPYAERPFVTESSGDDHSLSSPSTLLEVLRHLISHKHASEVARNALELMINMVQVGSVQGGLGCLADAITGHASYYQASRLHGAFASDGNDDEGKCEDGGEAGLNSTGTGPGAGPGDRKQSQNYFSSPADDASLPLLQALLAGGCFKYPAFPSVSQVTCSLLDASAIRLIALLCRHPRTCRLVALWPSLPTLFSIVTQVNDVASFESSVEGPCMAIFLHCFSLPVGPTPVADITFSESIGSSRPGPRDTKTGAVIVPGLPRDHFLQHGFDMKVLAVLGRHYARLEAAEEAARGRASAGGASIPIVRRSGAGSSQPGHASMQSPRLVPHLHLCLLLLVGAEDDYRESTHAVLVKHHSRVLSVVLDGMLGAGLHHLQHLQQKSANVDGNSVTPLSVFPSRFFSPTSVCPFFCEVGAARRLANTITNTITTSASAAHTSSDIATSESIATDGAASRPSVVNSLDQQVMTVDRDFDGYKFPPLPLHTVLTAVNRVSQHEDRCKGLCSARRVECLVRVADILCGFVESSRAVGATSIGIGASKCTAEQAELFVTAMVAECLSVVADTLLRIGERFHEYLRDERNFSELKSLFRPVGGLGDLIGGDGDGLVDHVLSRLLLLCATVEKALVGTRTESPPVLPFSTRRRLLHLRQIITAPVFWPSADSSKSSVDAELDASADADYSHGNTGDKNSRRRRSSLGKSTSIAGAVADAARGHSSDAGRDETVSSYRPFVPAPGSKKHMTISYCNSVVMGAGLTEAASADGVSNHQGNLGDLARVKALAVKLAEVLKAEVWVDTEGSRYVPPTSQPLPLLPSSGDSQSHMTTNAILGGNSGSSNSNNSSNSSSSSSAALPPGRIPPASAAGPHHSLTAMSISTVVLILLSEEYKRCPLCRLEAYWADELSSRGHCCVVFVSLQQGLGLSGWVEDFVNNRAIVALWTDAFVDLCVEKVVAAVTGRVATRT